jgi:hypothetical protein
LYELAVELAVPIQALVIACLLVSIFIFSTTMTCIFRGSRLVSRGGGTKTTTTTSVPKRKFGQPEEEEEEELETSDFEVGFVSEGGAFRSQKICKMTGFGARVVPAPEKVRLQELGSGEMGRDG